MVITKILNSFTQNLSMENIDKIYLIKWVGPFSSYEDLYEWEKNRLDNNADSFNLYLLQGKRKYARKYTYYC